MKKVMSIAFAALMIAGISSVYADNCSSCTKSEKKECSAEKKECSAEKKCCGSEACAAKKAEKK